LEILIIGVGEMGKLFSSYLSEEHQVAIYDLDRRKVEEIADERIKPLSDLSDLKDFESALLCVPISKVPGLVEELSGKMRKGSVIMEISSVKSPVIGSMRKLPRIGIKGISFHPLFGPGIGDIRNGRAAVIEVTNIEDEISYLSSLFPFELIPMSLEDHDRAMAWLGLIHLITNSFLSSSDDDSDLLRSASTKTISWFLRVSAATLNQSEVLSQELITQNPYFEEALGKFLKELNSRDFKEIRGKIKKWLEIIDIKGSYELLYRF
jgi:prephenate dehydrogenase